MPALSLAALVPAALMAAALGLERLERHLLRHTPTDQAHTNCRRDGPGA